MSSEPDKNNAAEPVSASQPEPLYDYICHPAKSNRNITALTILVIAVCIVLTYFITYSPFMTILGGVILFGALAGFFFPTHYFFYDDHLIVKTTMQALRKEWKQFRSYYPDKNGVLLSPFGRPTRLENFRGTYIRFAGNRDKVMAIVKDKIDFEADQ